MSEPTLKRLNIGISGCRGIPNHYGGYEQFAQYLAVGLQQRGHDVTVYQSSLHPYQQDEWQGVKLAQKYDPEDRLGSFGQFIYDFNCLLHARRQPFDILLQLGYTSNTIWYPLWSRKSVQVLHLDGLEWKRSKYGPLTRRFLKKMEAIAVREGDVLISDSIEIQRLTQQRYGKDSTFIPYGACTEIAPREEHLKAYHVTAGQYFLAIARFVPENNLEAIIQGYLNSESPYPLVLIGSVDTGHGKELRERYASKKIHFLGSVFDKPVLDSLRHFARLYFHGHSVGGTNPSLLEAMACDVAICAHDNAFNLSVLGEDAFYFAGAKQVSEAIKQHTQPDISAPWRQNNLAKIEKDYQWNDIIEQIEQLFYKALQREAPVLLDY